MHRSVEEEMVAIRVVDSTVEFDAVCGRPMLNVNIDMEVMADAASLAQLHHLISTARGPRWACRSR